MKFTCFNLCLTSTGETLKTMQVTVKKNVEFHDDESGRCNGEGFEGGNRKQLQRPQGW